MSDTLKPRQVEKPFLGRWVKATLVLLLGSPVTFGVAIALLATVHVLTRDLLRAGLIDDSMPLVVSVMLLPLLWIVISVLARHSDQPVGRSALIEHLMSGRVVGGGLPGCLLAGVSWLVHWALSTSPVVAGLLDSLTWDALVLVLPLGVCYCPLMALASGLSVTDAYQLSKIASRLNGEWAIVVFIAALALVADGLAWASPALSGVISGAFLLFTGLFNYVAYRDIFESRLEFATQQALSGARIRRAMPAR